MAVQIAAVVKCLPTHITLKGRLFSMRSRVAGETATRAYKCRARYFAGKGPFSCVSSHVGDEGALLTKRLGTNTAGKGFLSSVDSHVADELAPVIKCLATDTARIWFLACVGSHVAGERATLIKSHTTNTT